MKKGFSELASFLVGNAEARQGCLVDTTVLFSASYPLDPFNDDAETAFSVLSDLRVPVYSNFNVRSEFLELHRRVLIPECLIDLLRDREEILEPAVILRLKSLRTRYRTGHEKGVGFKLSDKEIKDFRALFARYEYDGKDGWELFCANYLGGKIELVWSEIVDQLGLNFLGLRSGEDNTELVDHFSWENATKLIGRFGIGSVDAMILELFFSSRFQILMTSDRDMAYCIEKFAQPKRFVFLPDRLL